METAVLAIHTVAGTIALCSGFLALFVAKGAKLHRASGNVFCIAMIGMGAGASYLGVLQDSSGDVITGILVIYLMLTAWATVRRQPGSVGVIEQVGFAIVLLSALASAWSVYMASTSESGSYNGSSTMVHAIGLVVLTLMTIGDLNNLLKKGLSGKARILRHLWRMCFAVFLAAGPIFIARVHVFPDLLSTPPGRYLLFAIPEVPLLLMLYWLVRIGVSKSYFSNKLSLKLKSY